jgi:hypothetical protein
MLHPVVADLTKIAPQLTSTLRQDQLDEAVRLLDAMPHPLAREDVAALVSLLPSDGDDACGLNWTILHAIEASPAWPLWELLDDPAHEWIVILRSRLRNAGQLHS